MKRANRHPRLFNEVLEAIAYLKDKGGSTKKTIMDQVDSILSMKRKQLRKDVNQFYRALQHGINTGLIKKKSGKYTLGLRPKDYRVFKNFQKIILCDDHFRKHRRRGRKGRRRRGRRRGSRRRRMHHSLGPSGTDEYNTDASLSSMSSPRVSASPEDRGRRRGRRRRRRRRRSGGRHGRGRRLSEEADTKERVPKRIVPEDDEKSSNDSIKSTGTRKWTVDKKKEHERNKRDDDIVDRNEEDQFEPRRENRGESVNVEGQQHCENPGCLCNMKKSQEGNRSQQ